MIGFKIMIAALLLFGLVLVASEATPLDRLEDMVASLKAHGFIKDGIMDFRIAEACLPEQFNSTDGFCGALRDVIMQFHRVESAWFCHHGNCDAKYDPLTGLCQCSDEQLSEAEAWPEKGCHSNVFCHAPYEAHWDPSLSACTCAVDTFPRFTPLMQFAPNYAKEHLYGPCIDAKEPRILSASFQHIDGLIGRLHAVIEEQIYQRQLSELSYIELLMQFCVDVTDTLVNGVPAKRAVTVRQFTSGAVSLAPLPTYIPPPNTEVTQELLQESLLIQPQQKAIVGSVIPHFADGVISFLVQLDGPISQTLTLNATDTLPCESIGAEPQPNLILVPKVVQNGAQQTMLPNCLVIAVNMYDPRYITYWIQRDDGAVFSLLSDNKIHAIDQLDTTQEVAVAIRVANADANIKRNLKYDTAVFERRQIYTIDCDKPCPFYHMDRIYSNDGHCGCMFKNAGHNVNAVARGVEQPSPYTATMTAEACAAMTCINNGGKPALFNPFTATCWCASPTYVEDNEHSYDGGL